MFQPLKQRVHYILDLDTVNVGFTSKAAISDAKRLQAPRRHCHKTRRRGCNSLSTITVKSLRQMESDFEIKGDRGQFTVQYLLQRSVGDR